MSGSITAAGLVRREEQNAELVRKHQSQTSHKKTAVTSTVSSIATAESDSLFHFDPLASLNLFSFRSTPSPDPSSSPTSQPSALSRESWESPTTASTDQVHSPFSLFDGPFSPAKPSHYPSRPAPLSADRDSDFSTQRSSASSSQSPTSPDKDSADFSYFSSQVSTTSRHSPSDTLSDLSAASPQSSSSPFAQAAPFSLEFSPPLASQPPPLPVFPREQIVESLSRAVHEEREDSPLTLDDIKAIEIFYIHHLPALMAYQGPHGERNTKIRAGYVFLHDGETYVLPRTIEIIDNLHKAGRTPYLLLNRLGKHDEEESPIDAQIGSGNYKVAKFAINLDDGELVTRLTMLDTELNRNEIQFLIKFNGRPGILPIYGYLHFDSKYLDETYHVIKKIAIFTPYCEKRDLFSFLESEEIHALFPNEQQRLRQLFHLIINALEGLDTLHSDLLVNVNGSLVPMGFVHRDVKLDNFLINLDRNGNLQAFLGDLGFASMVTRDPLIIGTAKYYSPELARTYLWGGNFFYSPSHDMYGFGLVLYACKFEEFPGGEYYEAAEHDDKDKIGKFYAIVDQQWKAGKRASLIDSVMRLDKTQKDPLGQIAMQDPILYLAYLCLQIDPAKRPTAKWCINFLKTHPLFTSPLKKQKDDEKKA